MRSHHFMANRWGNSGKCQTLFLGGLQNHCRWWLHHEIERHLLLRRKAVTNLDSILKSRDIIADKSLSSQSYDFSSSHVWMWELDYKYSWAPKIWCFSTVMLENTFETPLDSKNIKPVNPKGNQFWIFIERADAEAETPILQPPDIKNCLNGKDYDVGKG